MKLEEQTDYLYDSDELYNDKVLLETLNQLEFKNVLEFIARFSFSELGKEYILRAMPIKNLEWLNIEHSLIEEMTQLIYKDNLPQFDGLTDIRQKLYRSMIENSVLSSTEILSVLDTIRVFRLVRNFFLDYDEQYPHLHEITRELYDNRILEKHITEAIDDSGEIRDNATKELHRIRSEIRIKSARLRDRLQKIMKKVTEEDISRDEFYSIREGRFVLPIKVENKRALPGIIHGISQTGSTVFLEPSEIIEMNNELSLLQNEESREVYKILANLTSEIGTDAKYFLNSLKIAGHLDAIAAKAKYAVEFGGIKPEISEENYIYLKDIRHPILYHTKGKKNVIPLSIEFKPDVRGHLISGPNAGGKTVALKSIGLNILMALSGIFPLGVCRTNFRYIYSSIGDQQSIENDLSTFSSQILRLKNIIEHCSKDSLVLVDEIGSGTDPQEGAALACGILDSFLNINLFFIATTHQSSLKTYALNKLEIANASLEFDDKKLKPTYKFLNGIPGNSYAFVLAETYGIPKHILSAARNYLGNRQSELEDSIKILQKYKSEAQQSALNAAEEKLKMEKLRKEYDEKLKELKAKKATYINEAKLEAEKIVISANSLIEKTIRELKEEKKTVSEIKSEFNKEKDVIEKEVESIKQTVEEQGSVPLSLKSGDYVLMPGNADTGVVLDADNINKIALVEFNGFKIRLPFHQLHTAKPEKKKNQHTEYIKFDVKSRIDVRGMRADETIKMLEDFISEAVVNNLEMISIVHGKGTGALRQAIHQYLKSLDSVASFRLGELVEGGAGVTIVNFR